MMNIDSIELHICKNALVDAIQTKENQIFLSASTYESERIRERIIELASSYGLTLSGNPLILPNGTTLTSLLPNSQTSAGYSGNVYVMNGLADANFSYVRDLILSWTMLKNHRVIFSSDVL
ncbi:terminase large subunit domain-containing protein [Vibrio fluvialis]|uniref:terminase large subunit domain-containing protein n=1 Tax=Vibrio fluvialis TaxID=676 RepID=UPI003BF5AE44